MNTLPTNLQWREIPQAWGEAAWTDVVHKGSAYPLPDGSDILIFKAKDGSLSFFKRTPTGSGSTTGPTTSGPAGESKPTYRYHYASGSGGLGGAHFDPKQNPEHFAPGAKHAAWGGHFTVHASDPKAGTVTVSHSADPSGAKRTLPVGHFAEHVKAYHAPAVEQHKQKLMGDLAHHQEKLAHHQERVSSLAAAAKKHGYEVPAEAAPAKSGKRYYPSAKGIYEVAEGVNEPGPHQRNLHPTRESAEKKAASRGWSTEHAGTFTKEAGKRGSPNWTPEAAMGAPPKGTPPTSQAAGAPAKGKTPKLDAASQAAAPAETPPTSQAAGAPTGGLDWSGGAASYPQQRVEHSLPRSTNLQRTTWTPNKPGDQHGTMRVHMHDGSIHDYGSVHHGDYSFVVDHPTSHGQAFAERIKGAHPHRLVRGATPEGKKHASEIVAEAKKAAGEAKASAANEKRAKEGLAPPAAAAKPAEPDPLDNEPFPMPESAAQAAPAKAPSKLDQAAAAAMPAESQPFQAKIPPLPPGAEPSAPTRKTERPKAQEKDNSFQAKIPPLPAGPGPDAPTRKVERPAAATSKLDAAAEKAAAPTRPAEAKAESQPETKGAPVRAPTTEERKKQLASAKAILAHPGMKREDEEKVAGSASRNNLRDYIAEVLNTKPSQRVGYSANQAKKLVKERPDVLKHEGLKEAYEQAMDHHHGRKYQEAPAKPAKAEKPSKLDASAKQPAPEKVPAAPEKVSAKEEPKPEEPKSEPADKHAEALKLEPAEMGGKGSDLPVARNRIRTWLSVLRDPGAEAATKATAKSKLDDFVAKNEHVLGGSDPRAKALAEAHKAIAGEKKVADPGAEGKGEDPFERAQRIYGVSADDIAAVKKRRGEDVAKHVSAGRHVEASDMLRQALQTHLSQSRGWSIAHAGKWLKEQEQGGAPAKKAAKKKP